MTSIKTSYFEMVKFKLRWILVAFALLIASLFSRSAMADKAMPSSNAYDYYERAAAAMPKNPPKSTLPPLAYNSSSVKIAPYHSALERNEAVLNAYAPSLKLLRQGFAFQFERPPQSYHSYSYGDRFYGSMRQIARVLSLESQVEGEKDDWAGAANSIVDGLRLSHDISHGTAIDMLVGQAVQAIVSENLNVVLSHVDVMAARQDAKRLEKTLSQKVLYADLLEKEKEHRLWAYEQMATSDDWPKEYPSNKNLAELKSIYAKAMNKLITSSRLPYPQRIKSIPVPHDPLSRAMLEMYCVPESLKYGAAQGLPLATYRTKNVFILIKFALQAYHLEYGEYPRTLKALIPDYLQKVPDDPFAAKQPLLYKSEKSKYTLYSIGPDGKDDGGKPIKKGSVLSNSKGDIVAGVKNW